MKGEQQAKDIGKRIRAKREQMGMTQEQLALKLGYKSKSSITKIENGTRDLRQKNIKVIADALETTPGYLMGWEVNEVEPIKFKQIFKTQVHTSRGDLRIEVGKALYKAREEADITRADIANRLGVSDVTVFNWENGNNPIDIDDFKEYCDIIDVNWIDLLSSLPSEKKKNGATVQK